MANAYKNKVVYNGNTLIDISDTTAIASDVNSGKYLYLADGSKVQGSQVVHNISKTLTRVSSSNVANKILDNGQLYCTLNPENGYLISSVTVTMGGVDITDEVFTGINSDSEPTPSATQHEIYFEFTDETDITIPVYYDDAYISTMITGYIPETYGQKIVNSASLDGVTWYTKPTVTWETLYEVTNKSPNADTPYNYFWLNEQSFGDVYPTEGSVWRITIDSNVYTITAHYLTQVNAVAVGNPLYSGGTDDGSGVPFNLYNVGWGAWVGDTDIPTIGHYIKIEHQVTA